MKALFISNNPSIADTTSTSYARMRAYADAIGQLNILMRGREGLAPRVDGALTVEVVKGAKLAGLRALARRAREIVAHEGIEVVSAQDPFEHGWAAYQAVKGTNAKLHLQVHTDYCSPWFVRSGILRSPTIAMPVKNRLRLGVADRILPKADGIRVVSERVKQSLIARYGTRIPEPAVIPIATPRDVPPAVPLPEHPFPFALITVGRLEPEKRIDDILAALARIRDQYPVVGLIVVGTGREEKRLKKLAASLELAGRVIFLGARDDAWGLMQSAQGYIQASAYEGYGITLVEAALARVPIITSDVGIVGEVLAGYEDVLATPPGDPTNLAYHIVALLEDRPAAELRVRNAEAKVVAHLAKYVNLPELIARDLARLTPGSKTS